MTAIPSRNDLIAAINDPDPANPLARQIEAAFTEFGEALNEQARRAHAVPTTLVLSVPRTEVEAFALELFTREIARMGVRVQVKADN